MLLVTYVSTQYTVVKYCVQLACVNSQWSRFFRGGTNHSVYSLTSRIQSEGTCSLVSNTAFLVFELEVKALKLPVHGMAICLIPNFADHLCYSMAGVLMCGGV